MEISFQQFHLDTLSLFLALLVSHLAALLCSAVVLLVRPGFKGARFWLIAQALATLALTLTTLGAGEYDWLRILGNTCYLLSGQFFIHSMWTLRHNSGFRYWTYGLVAAAGLFFYFARELPAGMRILVFSLVYAGQNIYLFALTVARVDASFRLAAWLTGIPFLLIGLGNLVRLAGAVLPNQSTDPAIGGGVNNVIYLLAVATSFFIFFGYYLLSSRHLDQALAEAKEKLQQKNAALEQLNRDNNTIISVIAHDLASPLASAGRLVKNHMTVPGLEESKRQEYCSVLGDYLDFSQSLLQKVLVWARSSHDNFAFNDLPISSAMIQGDILPSIINHANSKRIAFSIEISGLDQEEFSTDPAILGLLINNLCMNAIKFTPSGGQVRFSCRLTDSKELECTVEDSGIGIDLQTLDTILSGESTYSSRGTDGENGSGLGLKLCRNFLNRTGGRLLATSEVGKGSSFTFTLPSTTRGESLKS